MIRSAPRLAMRTALVVGCCLALACCSGTTSGDTPPPLADASTVITVMVMDSHDVASLDAGKAQALSVASPDGFGCVVVIRASDVRPDNWSHLGEIINHEFAHCQGWRHGKGTFSASRP
jgi:hypothetical protein